jgi:hypothetical protein
VYPARKVDAAASLIDHARMRFPGALLIAATFLLAPRAHGQDVAASLGKQRAARSAIEWDIREAGHPGLGNIRYAYIKRPVETRVGNSTVYTRAYFSCQKGTNRFALELSNAVAPADPSGLQPASDPRLVCNRPTGPGNAPITKEELLVVWEVNEKLGDTLARGLRAFALRECAAIGVVQEVVLPSGWAAKTARIEFELLPYSRALDSIFATCGEQSAYAPEPVAPKAAAAAPMPAPAMPAPAAARVATSQPAAPPRPPAPQAGADTPWRSARVVPTGMTNLRAAPTLQAPIVVQLFPGAVVQIQRTETDWWRVRSQTPNGQTVSGFIREDRLVLGK